MRILVIDDKTEELERAKLAAEELQDEGLEIETVNTREVNGIIEYVYSRLQSGKYDGVVTDLMFNPVPKSQRSSKFYEEDNTPPAGLLIVICCISLGIPVSICTDSGEGKLAKQMTKAGGGPGSVGDHRGQYGWIKDTTGPIFPYLFYMSGEKIWQRAFYDLIDHNKRALAP